MIIDSLIIGRFCNMTVLGGGALRSIILWTDKKSSETGGSDYTCKFCDKGELSDTHMAVEGILSSS